MVRAATTLPTLLVVLATTQIATRVKPSSARRTISRESWVVFPESWIVLSAIVCTWGYKVSFLRRVLT
jgi:hypothetical protein